MGLSAKHESDSDSEVSNTFSGDVLRLEISGPDQVHLSVIDVPGIFKNRSAGETTKADIQLVRDMVLGYMQNPRSVMLTVIPANVDIATQEILEMASEVDPDGIRTIGVLTKPDLVDKGSEHRVMDLLAGKKHSLNLGWHLVRNLGQAEMEDPAFDRSTLERNFFAKSEPWKHLEGDKVGINSLRDRLKDIVAAHTKREFPKVGRLSLHLTIGLLKM